MFALCTLYPTRFLGSVVLRATEKDSGRIVGFSCVYTSENTDTQIHQAILFPPNDFPRIRNAADVLVEVIAMDGTTLGPVPSPVQLEAEPNYPGLPLRRYLLVARCNTRPPGSMRFVVTEKKTGSVLGDDVLYADDQDAGEAQFTVPIDLRKHPGVSSVRDLLLEMVGMDGTREEYAGHVHLYVKKE